MSDYFASRSTPICPMRASTPLHNSSAPAQFVRPRSRRRLEYKMTVSKLRLAMVSTGQPETSVGELCQELGITRQTLYRHVDPKGNIRPDGAKLLQRRKNTVEVTAILT